MDSTSVNESTISGTKRGRSISLSPGQPNMSSGLWNEPVAQHESPLTPLRTTPTPSGFDRFESAPSPSPVALPPRNKNKGKGRVTSSAFATVPATVMDNTTKLPRPPMKRLKSESTSSHQSRVAFAEDESFVPPQSFVASEPESDDDRVSSEDGLRQYRLAPDEIESASSSEPDHPGDPDYKERHKVRRPRSEKNVGPKPSPKKRTSASSVATSAKQRVRIADPNRAICLLTNLPFPAPGLQFVHVAPRSTPDEILTSLEWELQSPYWTLYIDTQYNIFVLRADHHLSMDAGEWTLVPHHETIQHLAEWMTKLRQRDPTGFNKNSRVPISESYGTQTEFKYYVLPLTEQMKKVAIHRSTEEYDPENVDSFNPAALAMHLYPFSTIGPLTSHIHPHFVVFSAGEKLAKLTSNHPDSDALLANFAKIASFGHEGSTEEVIKQNLESLLTIVEIHEQWTSQRCPQLSDRPKHEWLRRPKEAKVTKKKKSKKSKKPQAE